MITCPSCGYENIDGVDQCDRCESPLAEASIPRAHSPAEHHILKDRLYVLSPKKPLVVAPEMPVMDVLRLLVNNATGVALVMKEEALIGIFSERDALFRLNAEAMDLGGQPISRFMTPSPQTLDVNDKIAFALHKMDVGGYRHIPVLTDGRVTGVISVRDILRYISDRLLASPV